MKKLSALFFLVMMQCSLLAYGATSLNSVMVVVNGEPITTHQFNAFYDRALTRAKASGQPMPSDTEFRQFLLNQYINRVLELQLAKRYNVTVTDEQLQKQIAVIATQQKITPQELADKATAEGYTVAQFHEEVKTEMIISLLEHQALGDRITVSQADIKAQMEKLKNDPQFSGEFHVVDYLTTLKPGASSAQLNHAISSSTGTDLGWRSLDNLPDMFSKVVPTLKANELSGLIQAPNGYHVIKLIGTRQSKTGVPAAQIVGQQLYMMKLQKELKTWQDTLRKQADIQMFQS